MYEFLKKIPLFAAMPDADFDRLCEIAEEVRLPAGAQLFAEGSPGMRAYVIMEGEVAIIKKSGDREVLLAIRPAGEVIGEMALLEQAPRMASVRAHTDAMLLAIHHDELDKLLNSSPSAARAMLATMVTRLRNTEAMLRESDKMAQLGTLSAGVAHELNNPAAAVQRGAGQLQDAIGRLGRARDALLALDLTQQQRESLATVEEELRQTANPRPNMSALDRSDLEYALEIWLEKKKAADPWEIAPALLEMGLDAETLDSLAPDDDEPFIDLLRLMTAEYSVQSLLKEVNHGAARIAEIVKALKSYTYLDQAPLQEVNIREGLDNTLIILRDKLKEIEIVRQIDEQLPTVHAYGSELNQVFTNILDNAADALEEQENARIIIRTRQEDSFLVIEFEDNGPGIAPEHLGRVFDAFYTTKPPGKGTGLGLNISYNIVVHRHRGDLAVRSEPGKTCFTIKLPMNAGDDNDRTSNQSSRVAESARSNDTELKAILASARTIAVVGMSFDPQKAAHTVPMYLRDQGYEIMPVNPRGGWLEGMRVHRDLLSLPKVPDVVLIFRPSAETPAIVEQAVQIAARVVWMELGIINDEAAASAEAAGLSVVMDTCMRTAHKRLMA